VDVKKALAASKLYVALGMLCLPLAGWSQTKAQTDEQLWRAANEAVGQFKRGHVDLLKWEQANPQVEHPIKARGEALALSGPEDAVRRSWKAQPELRTTLAHLNTETRDALATGRWDTIDPKLIRRVEGFREVIAATAQIRKDWVNAASAQVSAEQAVELLGAAQSARELGDRMVAIGNWSKIQQAPWQMAEASARMNSQRARMAMVQAQGRLIKDLGQVGMFQTVSISSPTGEFPKQALSEAQVNTRAATTREQLTYAERFASRDNVFQAYEAYLGAYENAGAAADILQLHEFVVDETVLHYNGMLKSTWDVLTEAQNRIQAINAAANARRDFEIARIDLDWVLLGGEPASYVSLGAGDAAPASAGQ